jgi:hypothetical protein
MKTNNKKGQRKRRTTETDSARNTQKDGRGTDTDAKTKK